MRETRTTSRTRAACPAPRFPCLHAALLMAGLAGSACSGGSSPDDGAADAGTQNDPDGGTPERDPNLSGRFGPADDPSTCSSGYQWNGGLSESQQMQPGGNCMGCHAQMGGPSFRVAGTVMRDVADVDRCAGVSGITVELTGSDSAKVTMLTNAAGNFLSGMRVATPYTARIVDGDGNERVMQTPQTSLNCMECHTATGANGAPGRIFIP